MTSVLLIAVLVLVVALASAGALHFSNRLRRGARPSAKGTRRILFPFLPNALAPRALDAALRLASAEDATLVPIFLAQVPLQLPLETPLPRQSELAIPLLEAIEQRAAEFGVAVDARVQRGRSHRHALREALAGERFDRIVIAAATDGCPGFSADDVAWLLETARGEIVVLRPNTAERISPRRRRRVPGRQRRGGVRPTRVREPALHP